MKKTIRWAIVLLVGGAMNLQAALIEVMRDTGSDLVAAGGVNISGSDQSGTLAAAVVWTDPAGGVNSVNAIRTKAYTITGIDFDGDTIEDVLTWTVRMDGELQGINAAGEGTSYDLSVAGSVVNSRSGYSSSVTFDGFTGYNSNASAGDLYGLGTGGIGSTDIGTGLEGNSVFSAVDQFTASWEAGGYSSSNVSYSFTVNTIPEPATLGLISAVGIGLFAARRLMI